MKIVYLHQYFRTPTMSGGTRSYEMARRLVRRGHTVHMITSDTAPRDRSQSSWYETEEAGINVHWLPVSYSNKSSFSERKKAFLKFAWYAASRAARIKVDLVFATSTPLTIAIPGIFAAKCRRTPFVFEVRDLWPELPIAMGALKNRFATAAARAMEKSAYSGAQQVIALSPGMKKGIVRRGIDADLVTVIPNSCDFELFDVPAERGQEFRSQLAWLQDRPLVVYTGALGLANGVHYLADLAAETRKLNPEVRFLVVGDGQQEKAVQQRARQLGVLDRNFFMAGRIAKSEIPNVLSAADLSTSLFLDIPELRANSANKFFDALAAGKPVAINHEGWIADLIRERRLGLVWGPRSMLTAAKTLSNFLDDRLQLKQAGQAARSTAKELFDRDRLATLFENVLLKAVGGEAIADSSDTALETLGRNAA